MSGGGGAPAVQAQYSYSSPFQNPAYNAVAMGTKQSPGPIARSIQIGNQLAQNWQDSYTGTHPGAYYGITDAQATPQFLANQRLQQGAWSPPNSQTAAGVNAFDPNRNRTIAEANPNLPTQTAAQGGIMSLGGQQGFASGGKTAPPWTDAMQSRYADLTAKQQGGTKLTAQERQVLNSLSKKNTAYQKYQTQQQQQQDQAAAAAAEAEVKQQQKSGVNAPYSMQQAVEQRTAYFDPTTGQSTNPLFNQAVGRIQEAQKLPSQFGQATDAYNKAISGLQGMTNYTPQQVQAAQAQAAQMSRGTVRDINAIQADVEKYRAANMAVPPDLQAEAYQAAQMQGAQMQGPQSWNAPGTVQQYMDPYQQAVIDQSKFEANRQAAQQRNQMRSQATGQKAFGGSRAALQESEANRNLGYLLEDIQNKGLSQAYQQGLQQFNTAQGQGLQAGQANLQAALTTQQQNQAAINAQRQLYVQQALDAAKTNYGGAMTAAQQNQVAQNAASQFNAQSQNQAYNNYVQQQLAAQQANQAQDWNVGNLNTMNQQQTNLANQQAAMQAALANQQAGLTANQQNLGAYGQMLSGAQGLGGLGASQASTNLANIGALGQAAQAQQNLGQQYLTGVQQSAQNYFNWPQQQLSYPINAINQLPSSGGATTQTQRPASALGWKKGGLMNLRKTRRA